MISVIRREIEREARKRLARVRRESVSAKYKRIKFEKRTGVHGAVSTKITPAYWGVGNHFNPLYCIKHSNFLAKGLWKSISGGDYSPVPAVELKIKKASGGERAIQIFSIPDSAVSNIFTRNMITRNDNIFSSSSFAYRKSKTPLDAIIHLRNLTRYGKVYTVSFDFKSYFDSIPEDHIRRNIFAKNSPLLTTNAERSIIRGFLRHKYADVTGYKSGSFVRRVQGIPQGTSISLFLANAAAHELDMQLEKMNGRFVRYADDVLIVTNSYEDAINASNTFREFSIRSGIPINEQKSQGIRILSHNGEAEIRSVDGIDFLGYRLNQNNILLSDRSMARMKRIVGKKIYNHLLLYPRKYGSFNTSRVGPGFLDWDLVTCINDIRRYLYGGPGEETVRNFLDAKATIRRFKGIAAYYCLVDTVRQFSELDGWLVNVLHRAHVERSKLLLSNYRVSVSSPTIEQIVDGTWYNYPSLKMETQCPSFVVSWRTARKKWSRKGLVGLSLPDDFYAYE